MTKVGGHGRRHAGRQGRGEDGSAAVATVAAAALVMIMLLGVADLGAFVIVRSRAQTAADAAALAAAGDLVLGGGNDPAGQAGKFASANGARLIQCLCPKGGAQVEVKVAIPVTLALLRGVSSVSARAKAEVDLSRLGS